MNEEKVIEVFRQIERERVKPGGVGFNMENWLSGEARVTVEDQPINVCKTTACFAGHALINEGYSIDVRESLFYSPLDGDQVDPELMGAKILGITEDQASDVFYLETLDDVYCWFASRMGVTEEVLRDKVNG